MKEVSRVLWKGEKSKRQRKNKVYLRVVTCEWEVKKEEMVEERSKKKG